MRAKKVTEKRQDRQTLAQGMKLLQPSAQAERRALQAEANVVHLKEKKPEAEKSKGKSRMRESMDE